MKSAPAESASRNLSELPVSRAADPAGEPVLTCPALRSPPLKHLFPVPDPVAAAHVRLDLDSTLRRQPPHDHVFPDTLSGVRGHAVPTAATQTSGFSNPPRCGSAASD